MFKFSSKLDSQKKVYAGYQMGSVIGVGAFGEVRSAIDSTGQHVAVKIVDVTRFADKKTTDEIKRRIQREVDVLQGTSNSHIIELLNVHHCVSYVGKFCINCGCTQYDSTELDLYGNETGPCKSCKPHDGLQHSATCTRNVTFMVQELAAGGELFSILKCTGPFSSKLAQYYFRQLISGVEYLHTMGIIHRDLKPENIVFSGDRFDLKIVDFGLATTLDISGDVNGLFHSGVGSTPYSAPEIYYQKELFQDQGYKGQPADIWSMAVILYIMLTGKPPFRRPLASNVLVLGSDSRTPLIRPPNNLRRDKHFMKLMAGVYPTEVPPPAQSVLSQIFVQNPDHRLTMDEMKKHSFVQNLDVSNVHREIEIPMYTRARKTFQYQNNHDSVALLDRLHSSATLSMAYMVHSTNSSQIATTDASLASDFGELSLDNKRHSSSSNSSSGSSHSHNNAGSRRSSRASSARTPNKPIVVGRNSGGSHSSRRISPQNLHTRDSLSMSMPSPNYMDEGILLQDTTNASHVVLSSSLGLVHLENMDFFREDGPYAEDEIDQDKSGRSNSAGSNHSHESTRPPTLVSHTSPTSRTVASSVGHEHAGTIARRNVFSRPSRSGSSMMTTPRLGNHNSSGADSDLIEVIYDQPDETDLNLQHELVSADWMNEENSEFYQEIIANGPLSLLLQHVKAVCSSNKNLWFKVHPSTNDSKMIELIWRDDLSKKNKTTFEYFSVVQLRCTVTFERVTEDVTNNDKFIMAIRRHEGSYEHFIKVVQAIRRRAVPRSHR